MRTGDQDELKRFALEWRAIASGVLSCGLVFEAEEEGYRLGGLLALRCGRLR